MEPIVVGKPSGFALDYIIKQLNISTSRIVLIGDRLDTDIKFGLNHEIKTCLTLSGVTESIQSIYKEGIIPHFYVNSVKDFVTNM